MFKYTRASLSLENPLQILLETVLICAGVLGIRLLFLRVRSKDFFRHNKCVPTNSFVSSQKFQLRAYHSYAEIGSTLVFRSRGTSRRSCKTL